MSECLAVVQSINGMPVQCLVMVYDPLQHIRAETVAGTKLKQCLLPHNAYCEHHSCSFVNLTIVQLK